MTEPLAWRPPGTRYVEVQFHQPHGRTYAYAWLGDGELELGDEVLAPRPPLWVGDHLGRAVVVALGSRYEGPVRAIRHRAPPRDPPRRTNAAPPV